MAGIIKADTGHSAHPELRRAAYHFEDWTERGQQYLDQIRQQAGRIIEQAKKQAEHLQEQARLAGQEAARRDAQQVALQELEERLATLLPAWREAADQLAAARALWLGAWERRLVDLAVAIAERVVRRELQHQPEIQLDWVREALELASGNQQVVVRLHPQDYESLSGRVEFIAESMSGLGQVSIAGDAHVRLGGCLVQTEFGEIDQQLQAQLDRLAGELKLDTDGTPDAP